MIDEVYRKSRLRRELRVAGFKSATKLDALSLDGMRVPAVPHGRICIASVPLQTVKSGHGAAEFTIFV